MTGSADIEACLPQSLRGPGTSIRRAPGGLSGASVFRVRAGGRDHVLKVASEGEPVADWRRRVGVLRAAADAGVAPRVVHVDEGRRAVLTEAVEDRSFVGWFSDPATRAAALAGLGEALSRVHALPIPPGVESKDPRVFLAEVWKGLSGAPVPGWVAEVVRRALDAVPPPPDRAPVLSHNDVNPTNYLYDGTRVVFLDWDSAGLNDPLYDLATVAVFLRLDDASCGQLIAAHDRTAPSTPLSPRFRYLRRMVAALCGALFLQVARTGGHVGTASGETLEAAPTLTEVHERMRVGVLSARTPDGQWQYGLGLLKASAQAE